MRDICIGDYIRTKSGNIGIVIDISQYPNEKPHYLVKWNIAKAFYITNISIKSFSDKRTEIIEVGDYVNGQKIVKITTDPFIKGQTDLWTDRRIPFSIGGDLEQERFIESEIKEIVTKEQFEKNKFIF